MQPGNRRKKYVRRSLLAVWLLMMLSCSAGLCAGAEEASAQIDNRRNDLIGSARKPERPAIDGEALRQKAEHPERNSEGIREDAQNILVLQENVTCVVSDSGRNVPVAVNADRQEIAFAEIDDGMRQITAGDILYVEPCENFPEGFLGKVETARTEEAEAVMTFSQPGIAEVIRYADISARFPISEANFSPDSEQASGGAALEKNEQIRTRSADTEFFEYYDVYSAQSGHGTVWGLWSGVGIASEVSFETEGFEKKEGGYGRLDMKLEAVADIMILAENLDLSVFSVYTAVDTNISALVGYRAGVDKTFRKRLPECVVPVSGPLTLTLKPYLTINTKGEFVVEATAELTNFMSFSVSMSEPENPIGTEFDPHISSEFHAEAEGRIEAGPEMEAELGLCGTPFFDGAVILSADAYMGLCVEGETSVEQSVSVSEDGYSYSGHQNTPDENGNLHLCYLCIQGEAHTVDRLTVRPGAEINRALKKVLGREFSWIMPDRTFHLFDWHYSTGEGYGPEFEYRKCPHMAYPVVFRVLEKNTVEPISGIAVNVSDYGSLLTGADGTGSGWLRDGAYRWEVSESGYEPETVSGTLEISGEKEEVLIELEKKNEETPVVISSCIAGYGGEVYVCNREVPGLTYVSFQPDGYDYTCAIGFYRDRLYCAYKEMGTSDYRGAIYSCLPDGSDQRLIAASEREHCTSFVILEHRIYYNYGNDEIFCTDLGTWEERRADKPEDQEACSYFDYRTPATRYCDGVKYYGDRESVYRVTDGKEEVVIANPGYEKWTDGIWLEGVAEGAVYFARYNDQSIASLYRMDLQTGEEEFLGSHPAAGGGDIFFNW